MVKLNFQQTLLQSSVLHNPSEIILIYNSAAQEHFNLFKNTYTIDPKHLIGKVCLLLQYTIKKVELILS